MKLTIRMLDFLKEKIKAGIEIELCESIDVFVISDNGMVNVEFSSKGNIKIDSLLEKIKDKIVDIINQSTNLTWEIKNDTIILKSGFVVFSDEFGDDLLEEYNDIDGNEYSYAGLYINGKHHKCNSMDLECPCNWEPDIDCFMFEKNLPE